MASNSRLPSDRLIYLRLSDDALLKLCRVDVFKGSGRGGQKKNKTSNAVRLTFSHLSVTDSSTRSQAANIEKAVRKMRMAIALDVDSAWKQRSHFKEASEEIAPYLQGGLIRINPGNAVFPIFIAALIDVYIKSNGNWRQVSEATKVSVSQLQKFAKKHGFLLEALKWLDERLSD